MLGPGDFADARGKSAVRCILSAQSSIAFGVGLYNERICVGRYTSLELNVVSCHRWCRCPQRGQLHLAEMK